MSIENERQCENTRAKLTELKQLYERKRRDPSTDARVQELTLYSLKRRITQFEEEIALFESHVGTSTH